jgi:hypothetical protein
MSKKQEEFKTNVYERNDDRYYVDSEDEDEGSTKNYIMHQQKQSEMKY